MHPCMHACCSRALWLSGGWQPWHAAYEALPAALRARISLWAAPAHHTLLLPRCAALLHPGGSGCTAAAALAGLPQVTCPLHFDQFFWVRGCVGGGAQRVAACLHMRMRARMCGVAVLAR